MKKKTAAFIMACLLCVCFFGGCAPAKNQPVSKTGVYFDTVITLTLYDKDASRHIKACFSMAEHYEDLFSRTKEGSDIWNINHSNGQTVSVDPETFALIGQAKAYGDASGGLFDITIGALTSLWDFTSDDPQIPSAAQISAALPAVDYRGIRLYEDTTGVQLASENAMLDLGGIAKGYVADRMKDYLLSQGVDQGIINLGGNILCLGPKDGDEKEYNIAIQKPFSDNGEPIASLRVSDASVVTSGTYQRCFEKDGVLYHHILDPSSGYPANNGLASVTVVSSRSADGDALSTACFLMGLTDGMAYIERLENTEAVFITDDGQIHTTSGIGSAIPFTLI